MSEEIAASQLLERLQVTEPDLSADQLRRWQGAGLLPRPRQVGLGRGQGSEVFYPACAFEIALVISGLLRERRSFSVIGWKLWLMGYPVDELYWRKPLEAAAADFDGVKDLVAARLEGDEDVFELFTDDAFEVTTGNALYKAFRKAVGRRRFLRAVTPLFEMMAGLYTGPSRLSDDDQDYETDRRLMHLALGFVPPPSSQRSRIVGLPAFDFIPVLAELCKALTGQPWQDALANADMSEIDMAKGELVNILGLINLLAQLEAEGLTSRMIGLKRAGRLRTQLSDREMPGLIIGWMMYARRPGVRDAANAFRRAFVRHGIPVDLNLERCRIDARKLNTKGEEASCSLNDLTRLMSKDGPCG